MKCRQAQSRLAVYSAEHLSDKELAALCEHLDNCPECHREWVVLQSTLLTLSTASQPVLSHEVSQRMWTCCEERLKRRAEQAASASNPLAPRSAGYDSDAAGPTLWGWLLQPQLGWATLGAAVAVLGSVVFLSPGQPEEQPMQFATSAEPATQVTFERPPEAAQPLVNHHAAMSIDPFTDHVGTTLVSYSATASQR